MHHCLTTVSQVLKANVSEMTAKNMAHYDVGFEAAFKHFVAFNETEADSNDGANCNRVIMFLTDGGSEHAEKVFKKYNKDKRVRI